MWNRTQCEDCGGWKNAGKGKRKCECKKCPDCGDGILDEALKCDACDFFAYPEEGNEN